jgi:hypothetical protein
LKNITGWRKITIKSPHFFISRTDNSPPDI